MEQYLFLCYPRCSTCGKAQKWLEAQGIACQVRDITVDNPTAEELDRWQTASGIPLKKFFNTSGQLYRQENLKDRLPHMSREEQLEVLASNGMLVKRPLLIGENLVLTGFREAEWESALNRD